MMKQPILFLSILFLTGISLLASCSKDNNLEHYTYYKPVFKSKAEVRANIKSGPVRNVVEAGKIFIRDNYLFLVDVNRGVHVVDVTNVDQPRKVAFILIPGCADIAVRGNFLYADCDKDLVTIDISNPTSASLKKVIPNIFPEKFYYNYYNGYSADTTKMVADWIRVDTAYVKNINPQPNVLYAASSPSNAATTTNGTGGSMSRFGLLNDRMYAVSNYDLKVFNMADASNPVFVKNTILNQGSIETIFPYGNNLFIGSQSGMFIYDTANPDNPVKLSQFTHARSCDPVIADNNTAYVTLHAGTTCGGYSNQLDVLDITSLTNPVFIKTYALTSPRGLSKDKNLLLICDGTAGLKIFDAANASDIWLIKQLPNMDAQDVITYKGTAIVTTTKGLYFVDYRDPVNAKVTGVIPVSK
ncbi:LVIVD repeat-containing protein [Mucilaginibacter arboris]|uniref:LVIVD repeat-containing protein n=1 Tax=Mucilaginibacter arboris TaxID=2682090 RepID=A0A7K1SVS5_9SPHI|nr:hypothetical protein [Mucilaginibacter arboris]MVN21160.1 hypothetical protein [Mucilaginibacter arboris]